MRHVPLSEFKDKLSEIVAAAEAGEQITITRHGRESVRLVGVDHDRAERRRAAVESLAALGREIRERHGPTTAAEIRAWIDEGRS